MRATQLRKQIALLSSGGMLLGVTGVVSQIDFGGIFVTLVASILRIVISAIFGADVSSQILASLLG